MSGLTITNLAQQVQDLLAKTKQQNTNLAAWLGGSADGGPNNDGLYPFVDLTGREILVPAPAKLADTATGPAAQAVAAMLAAQASEQAAGGSASHATDQRILAEAARGAAVEARNLAQEHRNHAGTSEANARYWAELAQSKGEGSSEDRAVVEQLAEEVADNAALAAQDAQNAAASAALAATFDPNLFDQKSDTIPSSRLTGVIDIARIPVLPSQLQFVSSGGLASLTPEQQSEIGRGSIVTTTDGYRYVYSGSGSKTAAASYTVLADITPAWDSVTDKPPYFPTNIANVAGLQSALDAKASLGSNWFSSTQGVRSASNHGYVTLVSGNAGSPGYVAFFGPDGTRWGYVGYNNGSDHIRIESEGGKSYRFSTRPMFGTATPWDSSNFNPSPTAKFVDRTGAWTRHQTEHGYIDFGPANTGYAHIYTDRPSFYFNQPILVNGKQVAVADADVSFRFINAASGNITTIGGGFVAAAPSGGVAMRQKDGTGAGGVAALFYKDTGNFYFLMTDDNAADGGYNGLRPLRIGLRDGYVVMANGVQIANGLTVDGIANSGDLSLTSGNGKGMRFWNNDGYKIYMSSASDATWGGRVSGETSSDYNMYFRMYSGANRGFVWLNDRTPVAGIDASGHVRSMGGLTVSGEVNISNGWCRVSGASGFYFQTYGGGWHMTDSSWIRAYQNKHIVTAGTMQMGAFTVTSDIRLKTNITPITNAAEIIDATNVYEFTKGGKRMYGMIAQEARAVAPILVSDSADLHPEDGDPILALDQTGYIPLLIDEVKALRHRVLQLEGMVA